MVTNGTTWLRPQAALCFSNAFFSQSAPSVAPVGPLKQIVQVFTPFLLHLLDQGLAKATMRRHRDNLWRLGGELIRCRYDDDELASKHVKHALRQLIEGDGGPLMWSRIAEAQQDSLDAT